MRQQFLVERPQLAPMRTLLPCFAASSTIAPELPVLLLAEADIARIDAVFVERLGAGGMVGQQLVADIVEIATSGTLTPRSISRSRLCGSAAAASSRSTVMRTISEPRAPERRDLGTVARCRRVRVGHGLDDDRMTAAPITDPTGDRDGSCAGASGRR